MTHDPPVTPQELRCEISKVLFYLHHHGKVPDHVMLCEKCASARYHLMKLRTLADWLERYGPMITEAMELLSEREDANEMRRENRKWNERKRALLAKWKKDGDEQKRD